MIEVENTDVNIVRNLIPMRNHMPASAYGLKAISDWFKLNCITLSLSNLSVTLTYSPCVISTFYDQYVSARLEYKLV